MAILDAAAKESLLMLRTSWEEMEKTRDKALLAGVTLPSFMNLKEIRISICVTLISYRDVGLLPEEDYCWLLEEFDGYFGCEEQAGNNENLVV